MKIDKVNASVHGNAIIVEKTDEIQNITIRTTQKSIGISHVPDEYKTSIYAMYYYLLIDDFDSFYATLKNVSHNVNNVEAEYHKDLYRDMDCIDIVPFEL